MERNQYIVTVELWKDGKVMSWNQAAIDTPPDVKATNLLDEIRDKFRKGCEQGTIVRVTDIFKL
ncbi:hypothetical protein D3C85_776500 [compost metagenome]